MKLGSKAISIIVWAVFGFTIHDLAVSMQFAVIPIGTLACISTRYPNYWVLRSRSIIFGLKNHDQTRVCAVYVFIRLGDSVVIYVVVLKSSNCRERYQIVCANLELKNYSSVWSFYSTRNPGWYVVLKSSICREMSTVSIEKEEKSIPWKDGSWRIRKWLASYCIALRVE